MSLDAPPIVRLGAGITAAVLLWVCVATLQFSHHLLAQRGINVLAGGADTWRGRVLDIAILAGCAEILLSFCGFCIVVIFWAFASGRCGVRAFNIIGGHVWHTLLVFIAGFAILVAWFSATSTR